MLSLCMIVRDNEAIIRDCLMSIRPWVDEMIVVDTGSNDATPNIAAELGAHVHHFPWCDDFSAARNESIRHAQGDWLFWMDSDDTITPECGRQLRELAHGPHEEAVLGYTMQVRCPGEGPNDWTVVDHVKLFRNHPEIRFEFCIHEQLLPSIRRLGGSVGWTDLYVTHSGSDPTPAARRRKCERDLRILQKEIQQRPNHPFALFNFGMTYADMGRHEEAVDAFARCLAHSTPDESHLRKAYALYAGSLCSLQRAAAAVALCQQGLELWRQDPELHFRRAVALHQEGRNEEAISEYRLALQPPESREFSSIDPSITGHKAWHNLGVVYRDMGQVDRAEICFREALRLCSTFLPSQLALADGLIERGKWQSAAVTINQFDDVVAAQSRRLRMACRRGDKPLAEEMVSQYVAEGPSPDWAESYREYLFTFGEPQEVIHEFRAIAEQEPENASVRRNLGVLCQMMGELDEARRWFVASLDLRPDAEQTLAQLNGLDS